MVPWRVLCGQGVPLRTRLMAASSVLCFIYFISMTTVAIILCWVDIIPSLFQGQRERQQRHKYFIIFTGINVFGNCLLCLITDTSVKRTVASHQRPVAKSKTKKSFHNVLNPQQRNRINTDVDNGARSSVASRSISASEINNDGFIDDNNMQVRERNVYSGTSYASTSHEKRHSERWQVCGICRAACPPRSHHCVLCQTCILKRDHHCFFLTVCIGYYNQKYFIMYCFYMMLGAFYGLVMIVMQLKSLYNVQFYGPQTFITLYFEVMGRLINSTYPGNAYVLLMFMLYGCLSAGLLTAGIWFWQLQLTFYGQTTYEVTSGKTNYSFNMRQNIQDVFGRVWWLHLVFPFPLPQSSDGTYRTSVKS